MENFCTRPRMSVKKLTSLGLHVELSGDKKKIRITISDNDLTKFKYDLIEEDYPHFLTENRSILELNFNNPIKRKDSTLSYFSSVQSDDLIFKYFINDLLPSIGFQVNEAIIYDL